MKGRREASFSRLTTAPDLPIYSGGLFVIDDAASVALASHTPQIGRGERCLSGLRVRPSRSAADRGELLARLRADVLEPRGLVLTDGERAGEYIVTGDGFQATDADRDAVIAWHRRAAVAQRFDVGPLADVGSAA